MWMNLIDWLNQVVFKYNRMLNMWMVKLKTFYQVICRFQLEYVAVENWTNGCTIQDFLREVSSDMILLKSFKYLHIFNHKTIVIVTPWNKNKTRIVSKNRYVMLKIFLQVEYCSVFCKINFWDIAESNMMNS